MTDHKKNKESKTRLRRKRPKGRFLTYISTFFILLAAALLFFYHYWEQPPLSESSLQLESIPNRSHTASEETSVEPLQAKQNSPQAVANAHMDEQSPNQAPIAYAGTDPKNILADQALLHGQAPSGSDANDGCKEKVAHIVDFYQHLDSQDYVQPFHLNSPSQQYFSRLIQKLIDNPPVVSGETNDLFTILQNTAHFFRIVGQNNIMLLKGILDQEKKSFEAILADFYTLTNHPSCLAEAFDVQLDPNALYDYAGFFLNTMGGRLYLFRRDSVSRMAVSYYSILIIDQANRHGKNRHGIDIRPAVDTLIAEIEQSGSQLKLKESYLDKLYELKERYYL